MIPLTMQPNFKPPLCAEIDRLNEREKVRKALGDKIKVRLLLGHDIDDAEMRELVEEWDRLSGEGNNGPR